MNEREKELKKIIIDNLELKDMEDFGASGVYLSLKAIENLAQAILAYIDKEYIKKDEVELSEQKIFDLIRDIPTQFLEDNFPKGQCQERGKAILFNAQSLISISKALASNPRAIMKEER